MKRKGRDGLESCVFKSNGFLKRDEDGHWYIPICTYPTHVGIIERESTCLKRNCTKYFRCYLPDQNAKYVMHEENFDSFKKELGVLTPKEIKCSLEDLS